MPFPVIRTCIICELVRPEALNKHILLGYFGVAPDVRIAVASFETPIQLYFVFAGGPGEGRFRVAVRITAPGGQTFDGSEAEGTLSLAAPTSNFFLGFSGILPGPGNYRATLLVNGEANFSTSFGLEPMPRSGMPPAPSLPR